eukprot:m.52025 g.52025  ORF g.52025 m.52025 type:complete len:77 (-) comp12670_c5_seq1:2504-2734(-)
MSGRKEEKGEEKKKKEQPAYLAVGSQDILEMGETRGKPSKQGEGRGWEKKKKEASVSKNNTWLRKHHCLGIDSSLI